MSKTAETLFVLRDNYSGTLKNIAQIQKSFTKDLDGLQKSLKELNRGRAEIKIDADKAKRELKAAQKAYTDYGDAASKAAAQQAQVRWDDAQQQLKAYDRQIRETTKAMEDLTGSQSKATASAAASESAAPPASAGGVESVATAVLGSQLAAQLGTSVASAFGAGISSAFGDSVGASVSTIGGSLASGAAGGAALGSIIPGLGTAVGAGIGAAVGLISGAIQDAAQKKQDRDQYFKDDVKNIYDEVVTIRQSMVTTGAEIAAERETTQMAFANLLKGEAANAPVYAYSAARDGGSLAYLLQQTQVGAGMDRNAYAADFLTKLNEFSRETPFEYDELASISKTLLTYGYNSSNMFDMLTKIGDAGSALGWDSSSKTAVATYIGRMNLTDKVTMEYINPLIGRGIDAIGYITESLKTDSGKAVTEQDVMQMISRGELSGKAVAQTLIEYMGSDFAGSMEEMQNSYAGLESTIAGWEADMQAAFGEKFNEKRKEQMHEQIDWYEENGDALKEMYGKVGEYEASLIGEKERTMRESMDELLEKAGEIPTGEQMSDELYAALVDAQVKYNQSDAYNDYFDSQLSLIQTTRDKLVSEGTYRNFGYEMAQEFTKGYNAALSASMGIGEAEPNAAPNATPEPIVSPGPLPPPAFAYGIRSVPYDDFAARLHQGERVLTAAQARSADMAASPQVTITGNTFVVREESDIDAIALALYERFATASAVYTG